jgi:hypothetical protein
MTRWMLRPTAGLVLLLWTGAGAGAFTTAEWRVLERETPRYATALGAVAGREAACGMTAAAAARGTEFQTFVSRYFTADSEAKQIETFELAAAAARRAGCDRYVRARELARAKAARAHIEPVLRDNGF